MNFLTVYAENVNAAINAIDMIAQEIKLEVVASDPARLFNDENHADVPLPCFTFKTENTFDKVKECTPKSAYLCQEETEDWI